MSKKFFNLNSGEKLSKIRENNALSKDLISNNLEDNSVKEAKRGRKGFFGEEERQPNRRGGIGEKIRENVRSSSADSIQSNSSGKNCEINVDFVSGIENSLKNRDGPITPISGYEVAIDKRLSPMVDPTFAVATEKIRENSSDPGIFRDNNVNNRPKSSEKLTQNSSVHRSNSTKYAQKVDKFRQNKKDRDFSRVNRKGFSSKNYVQNAAGKSSSVVDLIGNKDEKFCEINGGKSFVPPLLNFADKDVEFVKDDDQNRGNGGDVQRSYLSNYEICGENRDERFRKNNVEIFRKAFGDGHYLNQNEIMTSNGGLKEHDAIGKNNRNESLSSSVASTFGKGAEVRPGIFLLIILLKLAERALLAKMMIKLPGLKEAERATLAIFLEVSKAMERNR